ncbi:MAG TPA: hypothetical protein VFH94_03015, partial [Streptomyces sp.]|nr:hypothetical protein [Streptomyces sp.]
EPRPKAWRQALTGTPAHRRTVELPDGSRAEFSTDGCVTAASDRVYGKDWDVLEVTASGLASRVLTAVEKDPGHRSAIRRWAACMSGEGYDGYAADGLQAPRKQLNARLEGAVANPETLRALAEDEIRTAQADADCQVRTELAEAVRRAQSAVERKVLTARDRSTVERFTALKRRALGAKAAP